MGDRREKLNLKFKHPSVKRCVSYRRDVSLGEEREREFCPGGMRLKSCHMAPLEISGLFSRNCGLTMDNDYVKGTTLT